MKRVNDSDGDNRTNSDQLMRMVAVNGDMLRMMAVNGDIVQIMNDYPYRGIIICTDRLYGL